MADKIKIEFTSDQIKSIIREEEESLLPQWMEECPLCSDWCKYNGDVYYAQINVEESEKRNKAVFDLSYCATKSLNGIVLIQRVWNKKTFNPWEGHSKWKH